MLNLQNVNWFQTYRIEIQRNEGSFECLGSYIITKCMFVPTMLYKIIMRRGGVGFYKNTLIFGFGILIQNENKYNMRIQECVRRK